MEEQEKIELESQLKDVFRMCDARLNEFIGFNGRDHNFDTKTTEINNVLRLYESMYRKLSQEEKYKPLMENIKKKMNPIYNYLFNKSSDEYLNNVECAGREC